ncbi:winged helix-turn-helix domain-containing protein [Sporolactobacillus spathodeae]|uniref:DNA-binding response OmpR family regulator n=1 Tax=Sporolactobacillus spathodeae TaxID=1465502 RepID=A0ABS2QA99_9BACL|nr:DNA-binding response OmpR family regulator [Sporolactobacillus spathodeae]
MAKDKILVLEDELSIRSFIVLNLKYADFEVYEAGRGEEALQLLKEHPDIRIALLDVMLEGLSGFEVCKKIRESGMKTGIIILTARVQESDKIHGLTIGADDYMTKPFSPAEMVARVQSLLRRLNNNDSSEQPEALVTGIFKLTVEDELFYKNDEPIDLTPTEFELIRTLMNNENQLLSRNQLIDAVWGENFVGDPKIIDVNIRRLRQKIEDDPAQPKYIKTHWGRGYIWSGLGE